MMARQPGPWGIQIYRRREWRVGTAGQPFFAAAEFNGWLGGDGL